MPLPEPGRLRSTPRQARLLRTPRLMCRHAKGGHPRLSAGSAALPRSRAGAPGRSEGRDPRPGSVSRRGPGDGPRVLRAARRSRAAIAWQYLQGAEVGPRHCPAGPRRPHCMGGTGRAAAEHVLERRRRGQAGFARGHRLGNRSPTRLLRTRRSSPAVFMLWGNHARAKAPLVDRTRHLVLEAAHPSPLSARKFLGCRHFSQANAFLAAHGAEPVYRVGPVAIRLSGVRSNVR